MDNIVFKPSQLSVVSIDDIKPNKWNPKDKNTPEFQMIKKGIASKGLQAPVFVRKMEDHWEIVDGEQRWTACKELGYTKMIIYDMGELTEQQAKEMTLWFEHKVPFNEIMLSHLLDNMKDLPELVVPFTDEQLENYSAMAQLHWENYQDGEIQLEYVDSVKDNIFKVTESQVAEMRKIAEQGQGDEVVKLMTIEKIKMTKEQKEALFQAITMYKKQNPDATDGEAIDSFAMKFIAKGEENGRN